MPTTNNEILSDKSPIGDLCLFVTIPDDQQWLWMFAKAVAQPSLRRWWFNDDSGEADEMRDAWDSRVYQPLVEAILTGECCVAIADCIENNVTTQTAIGIAIENNSDLAITINNIMQNIGTIDPDKVDPDVILIPTRFPQTERDNNVHIPPPSCDKDALWAGIRETVARLDDGARQFLEQAVAQADKAERAANIISAIPIVGDLTAALITTFSELAPDLLNLFNAYSSAQNIDDTACALFEIVCQECRYPTYQEYWNHYSNLGINGLDDIGSLTFTAITDLLFGTQNLAALVAYHTIISYQLYVLYLGSKFTSYRGTKWLNIWADIGEDNPTNGWELLCTGCADINTWCHVWVGAQIADDFEEANTGSVNFTASGAESAQYNIVGTGNRTGVEIQLKSTIGFSDYNHIEFTGQHSGNGGGITYPYNIFDQTSGAFAVLARWSWAQIPSGVGVDNTLVWDGTRNMQIPYVGIIVAASHSVETSIITRIELRGTGTKPAFIGGTAC